ncbi:hypothetical protein FPQ18DRAFT_7442 [Pyronema domesticum]|nr:hypothetical protein FPQ18DRAFT_7442 [Pyronema domesticum]
MEREAGSEVNEGKLKINLQKLKDYTEHEMAAWPNGKALDYESRDCRFDPCCGHYISSFFASLASSLVSLIYSLLTEKDHGKFLFTHGSWGGGGIANVRMVLPNVRGDCGDCQVCIIFFESPEVGMLLIYR